MLCLVILKADEDFWSAGYATVMDVADLLQILKCYPHLWSLLVNLFLFWTGVQTSVRQSVLRWLSLINPATNVAFFFFFFTLITWFEQILTLFSTWSSKATAPSAVDLIRTVSLVWESWNAPLSGFTVWRTNLLSV